MCLRAKLLEKKEPSSYTTDHSSFHVGHYILQVFTQNTTREKRDPEDFQPFQSQLTHPSPHDLPSTIHAAT